MNIKSNIIKWINKHAGIDAMRCDIKRLESQLSTIEEWFGPDSNMLAMDTSLKGDTLVIFISRLRGGVIKFLPVRFNTYHEMVEFAKMIEGHFGECSYVFDGPGGVSDIIVDHIRRDRKVQHHESIITRPGT